LLLIVYLLFANRITPIQRRLTVIRSEAMRNSARLFASVLCLVLAAPGFIPSASAADVEVVPEELAPNWTGFYVGAGGGWGAFTSESDASAINDCCNDPEIFLDASLGDNGGFGTVQIGGDWQMDRFLIGAFADFTFRRSVELEAEADSDNSGSAEQDINTWADPGHSWTVGGRLGGLINEMALLYALAGYTRTKFDHGMDYELTGHDSSEEGTGIHEEDWVSGITFGAGIEALFSENWSVKLEYRHTNYKDFGAEILDIGWQDNLNDFGDENHNVDEDSGRLTVNFRF
jgi:outer membrane immunogenic protein